MSKTYTGGYRLVSLAFVDLALASTAIAVAGLGDALGIKLRKRVVLTDIVVSGEKKNDVTVQVKKDDDNYVIEDVYGYDLEIVTNGSTLKATPHADRITASDIDSGSATSGQVLTADGNGGVAFANPSGDTGIKLYKHNIQGGSFGNNGNFVFLSKDADPYTFTYDGGTGVQFRKNGELAFNLRQLLSNVISPTYQHYNTYPDAIIHTSTTAVYVIANGDTVTLTEQVIATSENVSTLVDTVTEF